MKPTQIKDSKKEDISIKVFTDIKDKNRTRPLYEEIFDEDPKAFVDYYYKDRILDGEVVVALNSDGVIISMAHLNPVTLMVEGQEVKVFYIYAVATEKKYRRREIMRAVLEKAFDELTEMHVPFCYLIPVDEDIYKPFNFETVSGFTGDRDLSLKEISKVYDIYIKETPEYKRRRLIEKEFGDDGLPENPVIMARILDRDAFIQMSGLPEYSLDAQLLDWLRTKRIYITEDV